MNLMSTAHFHITLFFSLPFVCWLVGCLARLFRCTPFQLRRFIDVHCHFRVLYHYPNHCNRFCSPSFSQQTTICAAYLFTYNTINSKSMGSFFDEFLIYWTRLWILQFFFISEEIGRDFWWFDDCWCFLSIDCIVGFGASSTGFGAVVFVLAGPLQERNL